MKNTDFKVYVFSNIEEHSRKIKSWYEDRLISPFSIRTISNSVAFEQIENSKTSLLFFVSSDDWEKDKEQLLTLRRNKNRLRILLCAESNHAMEAWKLSVFHFLEFPLSHRFLHIAFKKFEQENNLNKEIFLTIRHNKRLFRINLNNILFAQADGNYTYLYIDSGERISFHITMQLGKLEEKLSPNPAILRFCRSYLINVDRVESVGNKTVTFSNTRLKPIPLKGRCLKYLEDYFAQC